MAKKRDYAKEYARRKAKGRAAGKTTQQARGHKPREHVARAARERREHGGLTIRELRQIEKFAEGQGTTRQRRAEAFEAFSRVAQEHGYGAINDIKARLAAIERQRRADDKRIPKSDAAGRAAAKMDRIALMYDLADDYDIDVEFLNY